MGGCLKIRLVNIKCADSAFSPLLVWKNQPVRFDYIKKSYTALELWSGIEEDLLRPVNDHNDDDDVERTSDL